MVDTLTNIQKFLFETLPEYFHVEDSNKDSNGKGTLERYFEVMEPELEYPYLKIKNLYKCILPSEVDDDLLFILGKNYGSPPKLFNFTSTYKRFLEGFRELMAYKGTLKGLEMLFKLLGGTIEVVDVTPEPAIYDTDQKYDTRLKHDTYFREFFFINVTITHPTWDIPLTQDFVMELIDLIYFMLPINVFLANLIVNEEEEGGFLLDETGRILKTSNDYLLKAS